ncbi:MAG: hypothetical protein ABWY18_02415 [Tardiphaga sp.]
MPQLDDLLAGAEVRLSDDILDRYVPLGIDAGIDEAAYHPPAITEATMRRRPIAERAAA